MQMHIYGHVPNFLSPKFDLNTLLSFDSNHRYHLIHSNIFAMLKQRHQSSFVMVCARNVKSINCYAVKNNFFNCFVNFLCLLNAAEINSLNWSLYQKRQCIALEKKKKLSVYQICRHSNNISLCLSQKLISSVYLPSPHSDELIMTKKSSQSVFESFKTHVHSSQYDLQFSICTI